MQQLREHAVSAVLQLVDGRDQTDANMHGRRSATRGLVSACKSFGTPPFGIVRRDVVLPGQPLVRYNLKVV